MLRERVRGDEDPSMGMRSEMPTHERRQHKRFLIKGGTLSFDYESLGRMVDVSVGGVAFEYYSSVAWPAKQIEMDISFGPADFFLDNVLLDTVNDLALTEKMAPDNKRKWRRSMRFRNLSPEKRAMLERFLQTHATGTA